MDKKKKLPPMPDLHFGQHADGTYFAEWHTYHGVGETMQEALDDMMAQIKQHKEK